MFRPDHLREIVRLAEAAYPNEACGLFVGSSWDEARLVEMENLQDRYHALDPERFPRTSRTAYLMHPMRLMDEVDKGGRLLCIWHSHGDVGAYFSDEDVKVALGGGDEPLWPGTSYLVVSARKDGVDGAMLFEWNPETRTFDGLDVEMPSGESGGC